MLTIFTGQGVIGKLVYHLVSSLADKKLALALDEKKRACRSFVELYQFVERLEELTLDLTRQLQDGAKHGRVEPYYLEITQRSIESASNRFLETRAELHRTIDILDPILAESLYQLYDAKYSFLMAISDGLMDLEPASDDSVPFLEPDDRIVNIDMSKYGTWHAKRTNLAAGQAEAVEWPQSLFWGGNYEQAFTPKRLLLSDRAQAIALADQIELHSLALIDARTLLRQFISQNFAVDDILYVSRNLERERW